MSTHLAGIALGKTTQELGSGFPPAWDFPSYSPIVNAASDIFTMARLIKLVVNTTSGTYVSANQPLAIPFILPRPETVYQLGWTNGSSAGDNADVGIYDASWTRLVSAGSTACVGNSTAQYVDVADTTLSANTVYYLVGVRDTTTANRTRRWTVSSGSDIFGMLGCYTTSTPSFPLPNPLAGMALVNATFTTVTDFAIAFRTLV